MNRKIILKSRPVGKPTKANFDISDVTEPVIKGGELLLKSKFMSVDPYMRGRMNDGKSYIEPFAVGEAIAGGMVAEVVDSKDSNFKLGDHVVGMFPWQEVFSASGSEAKKVEKMALPLSYYLGVLGMPGLTAYFGLLDIGAPQKGETVVVSGAAGAVGVVVGQIAKIYGCRVVGIAGDDKKLGYLKNELGFDEVINYKTVSDMTMAIEEACPNGVDVYFDNVGGEISDAVYTKLNRLARIPLCGQISLYNSTEVPIGPRFQTDFIKNSILMKGFIVSDFAERFPEGIQQLASWLKEGKLVYKESVTKGFENLPEAFLGLFDGNNTGKAIVEV